MKVTLKKTISYYLNLKHLKAGIYIFIRINNFMSCFFLRLTNILNQSDFLNFITHGRLDQLNIDSISV
jgi:hypothetical protein